jgi:hypothetical protein
LVVMAITFHPDLRAMEFASLDIVDNGHIFSFYDTLHRLPADDPLVRSLGRDEVNYPPLAYLASTVFRLVLHPLMNRGVDNQILTGMQNITGKPQLLSELFLLKLPNLLADLSVAWVVTGFFPDPRKKRLAVILWLFNPLTLYATFGMGQVDIWPTLWMTLAGLAVTRNKPVAAAALLGIGGLYKLFPLLLLVPLILLQGKTWLQKLRLGAVGFGIYLLGTLPFILFSPGYRASALLTPQVDKMLFARILVSGDQFLSLFVVGFSLIVFLTHFERRQWWLIYWAAVLLLFYAVTNYHPQWFLWVTPWLIFFVIKDRRFWWPVLLILICDIGITLSFDASLHYGLFVPLFPALARSTSPLPALVGRILPFPTVVSLIRSVLAGIVAYFLYLAVRERRKLSL